MYFWSLPVYIHWFSLLSRRTERLREISLTLKTCFSCHVCQLYSESRGHHFYSEYIGRWMYGDLWELYGIWFICTWAANIFLAYHHCQCVRSKHLHSRVAVVKRAETRTRIIGYKYIQWIRTQAEVVNWEMVRRLLPEHMNAGFRPIAWVQISSDQISSAIRFHSSSKKSKVTTDTKRI